MEEFWFRDSYINIKKEYYRVLSKAILLACIFSFCYVNVMNESDQISFIVSMFGIYFVLGFAFPLSDQIFNLSEAYKEYKRQNPEDEFFV